MVRVYCEVLIVVFKMHETLASIDRNLASPPAQPATPASADAAPAPATS